MAEIKKNLDTIYEKITNTKIKKNISYHITIVGVIKNQPFERIKEATEVGLKVFGINYVQQGLQVVSHINFKEDMELHFIGHIQSKKVKYLPNYHCIQSIDRMTIVEELNEHLIKLNKKIPILVEINIDNEPQKSGIKPEEAESFFERLMEFSNIKLKGIMSMPPNTYPVDSRRKYFSALRQIFENNKNKYGLEILSIGTSEDYLEAIEEGSNMIRLGTALFGARKYL